MSKAPVESDDLRDEYDFSEGVRGKYAGRLKDGGRVVVLDPDIAEVFPDSESVNRVLRAVADAARSIRETSKP